jgi:hypothetical protein
LSIFADNRQASADPQRQDSTYGIGDPLAAALISAVLRGMQSGRSPFGSNV